MRQEDTRELSVSSSWLREGQDCEAISREHQLVPPPRSHGGITPQGSPDPAVLCVVPSYFLMLSKPLKHSIHKTQSWVITVSLAKTCGVVQWLSDVLLMRKGNESHKSHLGQDSSASDHCTGDDTWYESGHKRWFSGLYFFFLFAVVLFVCPGISSWIFKCRTIPWSSSACCTLGCLLSIPSSPLHYLLARNSAPSKNETISRAILIKVGNPLPTWSYFWGRGEHHPACLLQLHCPINVLYWNWSEHSSHPVLRTAPKLDSVSTALLSGNSQVSFSELTLLWKNTHHFNLPRSRSTPANQNIHWTSSPNLGLQQLGTIGVTYGWCPNSPGVSKDTFVPFPCLATVKIIAKEAMSWTHSWSWRISTGLLQGKEIKKEMAGPDKIPSPPSCQTGGFCFRNRWEENPLHG